MFGVEPATRAGQLALEIFADVLAGAEPARLVRGAVRRVGDMLFIRDAALDLRAFERVFVCGAGKGSPAMASAVVELLGGRVDGGLVVGQLGVAPAVPPVQTMSGRHPVPDASSIAAGEAMLEFGARTRETDLTIFCLSGGASALMEATRRGITLESLQQLTQRLLLAGADIHTLNAVRGRLSRIKAGGLARTFRGHVIVLVLSDVVGNDLSVVGSGPFLVARASGHRAHAIALELERELPELVRQALVEPIAQATPSVEHVVIGSCALIWPLASDAARARGLEPVGYADPLRGEARVLARRIVRLARARCERGEQEFCLVFAGEPTVTVRGDGVGGRAQEMAVQAAIGLGPVPDVTLLAAGTDGADGPTDAAGGLVDAASASRARMAGYTARSALARNDSYRFLQAAGGLIRTGPTGTNVNDVVLVVRAR